MITQSMIDDALRYIGIPQGKADEQIRAKVYEGFEKLQQMIMLHKGQAKVTYQRVKVKLEEDYVGLCGTNYKIYSKDLSKLLKNSEICIVMAATLGIEVDRQIGLCQKFNMLEAMILDSCASVLIDKVCDDAEAEIIGSLKEGEYLTMRFSPGYGDVPLEVSGYILDLLMAQKRMGLTLTKAQMLLPTKSITALIGISNQKENRQKSCGHCNLVKHCDYRRRGEKCGL